MYSSETHVVASDKHNQNSLYFGLVSSLGCGTYKRIHATKCDLKWRKPTNIRVGGSILTSCSRFNKVMLFKLTKTPVYNKRRWFAFIRYVPVSLIRSDFSVALILVLLTSFQLHHDSTVFTSYFPVHVLRTIEVPPLTRTLLVKPSDESRF